jgi:hypothetical protein
VFKRLRGYRAAVKVETHRSAAVSLRQDNPALYEHILRTAEGDAVRAAASDPDAYVALWLAEAAKVDLTIEDNGDDGDHGDNLESLVEAIRDDLMTLPGASDGTRQYPAWAVDRYIKLLFVNMLRLADESFVSAGYQSAFTADSDIEVRLDSIIESAGLTAMLEQIKREVLITTED